MITPTTLLIALLVLKALLLTLIFFLWRTNTRLKEVNYIIFLMRRKGIITDKDLEELSKSTSTQDKPK